MKRGWCPTLHEPMAVADGLLVRVKPFGGRLTSAAAQTLAAAIDRHGNGIIELTSRANLQIRGLTPASAPKFAAEMIASNLASADANTERRRNVLLSPLAGDDPSAASGAMVLASQIETMLAVEPRLAALAPKFAIAIDAGGQLPLATIADITIRVGDQTNHIVIGDMQAACAPPRTVAILRDLALAAGSQRTRNLDAAALLARVGLVPVATAAPSSQKPRAGFIPIPSTKGAFLLGIPFGQFDTETLRHLADLADRHSDGTLRLTPWRAILLAPCAPVITAAAKLIVDPDDRRQDIAACIGSAGCAQGSVRARDDAAFLATVLRTGFLHVSGCAKGCAHPYPAPLALVADAGRYTLMRNGIPDTRGKLTLTEAATAIAR